MNGSQSVSQFSPMLARLPCARRAHRQQLSLHCDTTRLHFDHSEGLFEVFKMLRPPVLWLVFPVSLSVFSQKGAFFITCTCKLTYNFDLRT